MYKVDLSQRGIDQGALVRTTEFNDEYDARLAVVLTPECDLAQEKAEFVSLAGVGCSEEVLVRLAKQRSQTGEALSDPAKTRVKDNVGNMVDGRDYRWYFLKPTDEIPELSLGGFIDFQLIKALPVAKVLTLDVITELDMPWKHEMAARYAAFAGRIGTPEPEKRDRRAWVTALGKAILAAK